MAIRELENELFSTWSVNRDGFVSDGIISEIEYLSSARKICFILKEVNDPDGGGWDLRDFVSKGARSQTWNNITRWVKGIRALPGDLHWRNFDEISKKQRIDELQSICVINLKKSPGTHTTDYSSLESVANEDKLLIQRQFELYDPDITICGGTGELFKSVANFHAVEWHMTSRGIWWFERSPKKYVISYSHPEARVHKPLLIYGLIDAVREICS